MMMTNEKVLDIFVDYLKKDKALDVVSTRRGYAVMLWDFKGKDWSDVKCCTTPEALFDKLLDSFIAYEEYLLLHISAFIFGLAGTVVGLLGLAVLGLLQDANYTLRDFIKA